MEIKLTSIGDRGDLANERIGFKILKNCQLKYFVLFKTISTENGFYFKSENAYWFLPKEVKSGDRVVLYTKTGESSFKENIDGSKTYFEYWGLKEPLFPSKEDKVVLINVKNYKSL